MSNQTRIDTKWDPTAPAQLDKPLRWRKPRRVIVADLFADESTGVDVHDAFAVMHLASKHIFMVQTVNPERAHRILSSLLFAPDVARSVGTRFRDEAAVNEGPSLHNPVPSVLPNVWLGVTVENQEQADARIPVLLRTPASKRFVSLEPMLGPVDLPSTGALGCDCPVLELDDGTTEERCSGKCRFYSVTDRKRIDLVIVGGETGRNARPMHPDWVRSVRDQCTAAGVPFFFKGWGGKNKKQAGRVLDGRTWEQMP